MFVVKFFQNCLQRSEQQLCFSEFLSLNIQSSQSDLNSVLPIRLPLLIAPIDQDLAHFNLNSLGVFGLAHFVYQDSYDLGSSGFGHRIQKWNNLDEQNLHLLNLVYLNVGAS